METVNQENNATNNQTEEKTFTQDELNKILGERLDRERAKYADFDELKKKAEQFDEIQEQSKSELQKAQERAQALQSELDSIKEREAVRTVREAVAKETNVPANLLTGSTEEECKQQAEAILAFAQPSGYPAVKDGGEVRNVTTGTPKEQFAEWAREAFN